MRIKLKSVTLNLPIGNLQCEIGQSENDYIIALFNFLSGQRILFTPCENGCSKCKKYSIKSVQKIRKYISNQLDNIHIKSNYYNSLLLLREGCLNF